jgi:CRP-like cAMP-binding protein
MASVSARRLAADGAVWDTCPVVSAADPQRALRLLRQNPALGLGGARELHELSRLCAVRDYDDGALVVSAGLAQTHVLAVASGRLELYRQDREQDAQMLQGQLGAPAIFGDAELYSGVGVWMVSARARPEATAVQIPIAAFDAYVSNDAKVAAALYRDACARHMLTVQLAQFMRLAPTERMILAVMRSAAHAEADDAFRTRITKMDIARALGIDRKTVTRNVKSLEEKGIITQDGPDLVVRGSGARAEFADKTFGLGAFWGMPSPERTR